MAEKKSGQTEELFEMYGLKPSDFVHLHNHTQYSVLDGMTKIEGLIDRVKELGMEAVAVTDHGTMSGLVQLYKTAADGGIKPILGLEAYVAARKRTDRDPNKDKARYHITLLAMDNKGYQNLMYLSSESYISGFYYKPRIDHEILESHSEGVICLSGCAGSEISEAIRAGDYERAKELTQWYHSVFGDRFYMELQDHGHPESPTHWEAQNLINEGLKKLAQELDLPMIITCDGHYLMHEDQDAHEILLCVGTAAFLSDTKRMSLKDFELHVVDPKDIIKRWGKELPEAVKNTRKIADRCNVDLQLGRMLIPEYPLPKGETSEKEYLNKLVYRGLAERYGKQTPDVAATLDIASAKKLLTPEVVERAEFELGTIDKMGFNGYLLIVWDFINWGKNQGIIFGPGRGSAAGAIIAYALRITDVDPLKYGLMFERFLNPDRISMPDIDTDIQDTRRDEVVEYCAQKYGRSRVSNITTFGKMMGKMAVRDVARVLEVPYAEADRIAKLVPDPVQGRHIKLSKSVVENEDLAREYNSSPATKQVLDFAIQLEGTIRSHGVHACGVVIAPDDLNKYVPLEMAQKGVVATQFPMGEIEELGLLKMDFLGLSNLSILKNALRIIKKVYGQDINLDTMPLDDKETYALFQRGDTTGVFQLESAGMKRYLKDLKPDHFEDIIAMVALYRPGPMQFIDSFIKRKHGQEPITYLHQGLENSLRNTYGILVYQEQFMQISREWCGFTGGESDTLRKAVGKKKIDLMKKMKPKFIEGAVKVGGAKPEMAEKFWDQLEEFANYCFNKSHAACYGLIAYWTAYIKAHYPDAFMAALMTSDANNTDRLAIEIAECKRMGISVLPPSVNQSYPEFGIVKGENKIRFGMNAVKGVGAAIVEEICENRKTHGNFKSVCDFATRINSTKFNKKSWEAMVRTGGFDEFNDRSDILFNLDKVQAYGAKVQKEVASGQENLFNMLGVAEEGNAQNNLMQEEVEIKPAPQRSTTREWLTWERELLGLYISAHPLDNYDTYFSEQTTPFADIKPELDGASATIGGIITTARSILTKSGSKMAFITLEDKTDSLEVIVFPSIFEQVGAKLEQDAVIKVTGRIDAKNRDGSRSDEAKIIAEEIVVITDEELASYQATGKRAAAPKAVSKPAGKKYPSKASGVAAHGRPSNTKLSSSPVEPFTPPKVLENRKLFVHIKKPEDQAKLLDLKKTCLKHPGMEDIILVLENGDPNSKKAMRMPFRIDTSAQALITTLADLFTPEQVVVK